MKKRVVLKKGKHVATREGFFVLRFSKKVLLWLKPLSKKISIAGSIRRKVKNPVDIDIVLIPKDEEKIIEFLKTKGKFLQGGEKRASFKIEGVKTELYFTTPESWGATLLAYSSETGSAIGLRMVAKRRGLHLNQYGLYKNGKLLAGKTEREIYYALGRPYKEPGNR
jgi:DNA polymerase (family 10)